METSKPSDVVSRKTLRNSWSSLLIIKTRIPSYCTSPYFFTDEGRRYEKAEYVLLNSNGPFSHDSNIAAQIHLGAEGVKHQLTESDHGGASLTAVFERGHLKAHFPCFRMLYLFYHRKYFCA